MHEYIFTSFLILLLSVPCRSKETEEKPPLVQVFESMDVNQDGRVNFQETFNYLVSVISPFTTFGLSLFFCFSDIVL